jgi:hypothetical protein
MNSLEELIEQLKTTGLNEDQIGSVLNTTLDWLYEEYPVMAAVVDIWLKANGFETKQEA